MDYLKLTMIFTYLLFINLLAIVITVTDKIKAKKYKRRIPERQLFIVAGLGGAFSMFITMLIIRHKTRHKRFMIGLPIIFILQFALIYALFEFIK